MQFFVILEFFERVFLYKEIIMKNSKIKTCSYDCNEPADKILANIFRSSVHIISLKHFKAKN